MTDRPHENERKRAACPICGAPAVDAHRPFCSERCSDVDLGRWMRGHYAIPAEEAPATPPDEEEEG